MRRLLTPFQTHHNHTNEMIDANHLNEVQRAINEVEEELNQTKNLNFTQLSMTVLQNHKTVNAVQYLDAKNQFHFSSLASNTSFYLNEKSEGLCLTEGVLSASIRSTSLTGHLHHSKLNHFSLLTDAFVPVGAVMKYYLLVNEGQNVLELGENQLYLFNAKVVELREAIEDYQFMVYMKANQAGESPILYQAHLFFEDESVTASLGGVA